MAERPHVVQAIGKLHENDADIVDHGEQHLAEVLRLTLLARRERNGADLRHPFDDMGDLGPKELLDAFDRRHAPSTTSWSRPAAMATA
jgi:hypothetical protein